MAEDQTSKSRALAALDLLLRDDEGRVDSSAPPSQQLYDLRRSTGQVHRDDDLSINDDDDGSGSDDDGSGGGSAKAGGEPRAAVDNFLADPGNQTAWNDLVKSMKKRGSISKEAAWGNMTGLDRSAVVDEVISRNLRSVVAEGADEYVPSMDDYSFSPQEVDDGEGRPSRRRRARARGRGVVDAVRNSLTRSASGEKPSSNVDIMPRNLRTLVADEEGMDHVSTVGSHVGTITPSMLGVTDGDDDDHPMQSKGWSPRRMAVPLLVAVTFAIAVAAIALATGKDSSEPTVQAEGASVGMGNAPDGDAASARLGFCDECQWQNTEMTCLERVAWEVKEYQVTEEQAREANLIHCAVHWSDEFCGECPYRDMGVTCEERVIWEMERNELCRVDAEAAVLADCTGPAPSEGLEDEEELDLAGFCGECFWKDSDLTCEEKVAWEMEYSGLCKTDAQSAILPDCTAQAKDEEDVEDEKLVASANKDYSLEQGSTQAEGPEAGNSDFCGACPYRDTGLTCEEKVRSIEALCRVDAEYSVRFDCMWTYMGMGGEVDQIQGK